MEKFFRIQEMILVGIMAILGMVSLIYGGFIEGKAHCFLLAAMMFALSAVWVYDDRHKHKEGDYGRE